MVGSFETKYFMMLLSLCQNILFKYMGNYMVKNVLALKLSFINNGF